MLWWEYCGPDHWVKHTVGTGYQSWASGGAADFDGDGWVDMVVGDSWFRNPGTAVRTAASWTRFAHRRPAQRRGDHRRRRQRRRQAGRAVRGQQHPAAVVDAGGRRHQDLDQRAASSPTTSSRAGSSAISTATAATTSWWAIAGGTGRRARAPTRHVDANGHARDAPAFAPGGVRPTAPRPSPTWATSTATATWTSCCSSTGDPKVAWFENVDGKGTMWTVPPDRRPGRRPSPPRPATSCTACWSTTSTTTATWTCSRARTRASLWIYENTDGKGTFAEHLIASGPAHEAKAADVDCDGDLDIAGKPWGDPGDGAAGRSETIRAHVYFKNELVERGGARGVRPAQGRGLERAQQGPVQEVTA